MASINILDVLGLLLSWPVAAILVAIFFRRPIVNLLADIKRGKVGSVEFEKFDRVVRRSEELVGEMESLQILVARAALAEMRAVDDSPYAPAEHKHEIRLRADELQAHLEKILVKAKAR